MREDKLMIQDIMKNFLYITIMTLISLTAYSQSTGRALSTGNENYQQKNYSQAEASYRIANSKSPEKATADYNMGNSLYKQKLNNEAVSAYLRSAQKAQTKAEKHQAYHNLGNAYMKDKNYKAAEEAYKNALRNNPKDEETRYNYAVAKKLNEENPQQDQDNQDNQDNQDQNDQQNQDNKDNQDNQNQDNQNDQDNQDQNDQQNQDNKDSQDNQNQDKDNQDQKDKPEPSPQEQQEKQSKEQMERLLDAVNRDERAVQQRLINKDKKGEKTEAVQGARKKDW
ncbi:tetratricopeptide repeat protein [Myroides indicus]|uniref:Tetratricopeptide repeat protein n=1 Tax=Myroides indicus TaxID=1323422 RepID=A0A4R7EWD1_9FLAO|nr:tetratricopeptide repeat protein [Myroides indicus]TDS52180.1 tetratricopeptide repeat protein [Myroides indicus]